MLMKKINQKKVLEKVLFNNNSEKTIKKKEKIMIKLKNISSEQILSLNKKSYERPKSSKTTQSYYSSLKYNSSMKKFFPKKTADTTNSRPNSPNNYFEFGTNLFTNSSLNESDSKKIKKQRLFLIFK